MPPTSWKWTVSGSVRWTCPSASASARKTRIARSVARSGNPAASTIANTDFRAKWTELLRQVWLGLKNNSNASGANPTDPAYVALLCKALQDMMNNRRKNGQLAREEFAYVTTLNWFDLTLATVTP